MDRDVSAHVTASRRATYWTGIWEPTREAISKEVAWLRAALAPGSPVVAYTPQPSGVEISERVLRLNFSRWYALRTAALLLEQRGTLTHIFGGIGTSEHFLQLLGRRPLLFTVVIAGIPSRPAMYERVRHFVAESQGLRAALVDTGVDARRVDTIYPGIDINQYTPAPHIPNGRFTLLFASSPADPTEIDARGVGLLIELARVRPDIDIMVLWRQWGDVAAARSIIDSRQPPTNFRIEQRDARDMTTVYQQVHATTCFFAASVGKSAPNSLVEGFASGLPALVSDTCGLADLVSHWQAGVVTPRTLEGIVRGVDELRARYPEMRRQSRLLAEAHFDSNQALGRYAQIYDRLG